jgi:hypothetical protein
VQPIDTARAGHAGNAVSPAPSGAGTARKSGTPGDGGSGGAASGASGGAGAMPPPKTPYDLTRRTPGRRGSAAFQTDRKVTEFYDLTQGTLGKGGFGEVKIAVRKGDGKK